MNALYAKRRKLAADYRALCAKADYEGYTWNIEQDLDSLVQAINETESLIDDLEESTS
jgi:hypothetical protein